jgi:hypothetical protein
MQGGWSFSRIKSAVEVRLNGAEVLLVMAMKCWILAINSYCLAKAKEISSGNCLVGLHAER